MRWKERWKKWVRRRTTFMVVPEANRSVYRLGVPHYVLVSLSVTAVVALAGGVTLYFTGVERVLRAETLASELAGQKQSYELALGDKEVTIEQLQTGLSELSQQAEEIKHKMEALQKLQDELHDITGSGKDGSTVAALSASGDTSGSGNAVGGAMIPPTDRDTKALMSDSLGKFDKMSGDAGALIQSLSAAKATLLEKQHQYNITPNIWPSSGRTVTSTFGVRIDPFTRRLSMHEGLDVSGHTGDDIGATAEGKVVEAGFDAMKGNYVVIDHTKGIRTTYMHLSKILVQEVDYVTKRQKIGELGSTGRSTGPHIHYQITVNGNLVNPKSYLPE